MIQKYTDLDDLWCEWGVATSAIMDHIQENECLASGKRWTFEEAFWSKQPSKAYSLYISHRAFDSSVGSIVRLHVQAFVTKDGKITVKTNKREKIELV